MTEISDVQAYVAPQIERREQLEMPHIGVVSPQPV